jgi:starch-binding outer membrane protein, SusD/RagB family
MKTNKYKLLLVASLVTIFSNCGDKLNIEPAKSIDASTALKTSKDVKATLIGAYSKLGSVNLYGGGFSVYADLLASASDINFFGTFQGLTQIANKNTTVNNGFVSDTWLDAYSAINNANVVLNSLSLVNTVDQKTVEGEAKFIRGALYFELVKLFGKSWTEGDPSANLGVPLILTPTNTLEDASKKPSRSTVAQVYAQVIKDLKDAESLLPAPSSVTYYYATTGAATALLSRVYLAQNDFVNALDAANKVIQSAAYKLTNTYADEFPFTGRGVRIFNTTEDIFAQQVSEQSSYTDVYTTYGQNALNTYYGNSDVGGRGDIEMSIDFLNTYENGDDRLSLFTDDGSGSYFYSNKFDNQYGNVKILRLAEMYLTRAESNFRLGTSVGKNPLNDVNTIRERVKLPTLNSVTIEQILDERHRELAFEGQWLTDYKRTNTDINLVPPLPSNSTSLVFPIPQRELLVNSNLVQNEGYN